MQKQPISKKRWIEFLLSILKPEVMPGATGDQPESMGHVVSPEELVDLPQGSGLYQLRKPLPHEGSIQIFLDCADLAGTPQEGHFFGYDDGVLQVLTDLNNPEHSYLRFKSAASSEWKYWYAFLGAMNLPTTLEELEQTLRI